ncbi:MAG: SDR family oxidoreductase [Bacteroidia bacterium]|nr:SDR family oxidoreductase [Bacteroidia bacterium]
MANPWLLQKSIVIIGGTTGIGLAAAQSFVEHGANVVVVGRNEESVEKASQLLGEKGTAIVGDAAQSDTAMDAINLCKNKFGMFSGLYHVAGGSGRKFGDGPLHEMTLEGWNETFSMNLTSLMLSNQAAIKTFLDQKTSGSILNMGSVLGISPSPKYFVTHAYAATKSAVIGFSKSIASYYAAHNIRVNVLAPSLIETPMAQRATNDDLIMKFIKTKQPLGGGRIGQPADLNGAAVYFMSDYSNFTTGQVLSVDGGWSVSEGQF